MDDPRPGTAVLVSAEPRAIGRTARRTSSPSTDIARTRLHAQHVVDSRCKTPRDVVVALGAVQAQDYAQCLWAVGLRLPGSGVGDVEAALASGTVIRTWAMRGTLHLVPAEDTRWMLALLASRAMARLTPKVWAYHAMDHKRMTLAESVITKALSGGVAVNRRELTTLLGRAGIPDDRQQSYFILGYLSQHGIICAGPPRGRQQTFVLLDDWAPEQLVLDHDESLARLANRYFASHSPATVSDFANWSGLGSKEARRALASVADQFETAVIDDKEYVLSSEYHSERVGTHLLPAYDEFLIGYADRSASFARYSTTPISTYNGMFYATIVEDGQVIGLWRRTVKQTRVDIDLHPIASIDAQAMSSASEDVAQFYDKPCRLETKEPLVLTTRSPWHRAPRDV